MDNTKANIFIAELQDVEASLFLNSGIKLVGKMVSYDDECIVIVNDLNGVQLVMRNAIATIQKNISTRKW